MPSFTYNNNIPDGPNNPSVDQPKMQVNTQSINSILNVDMIGFGDVNGGWHRQVTYVDQMTDPGSASGQYRTYSKLSSGQSELFLQKDAVSTPIQLTRGTPAVIGNGSFSYLPGGFLIQWGSVTASGHTATVTFPVSFTSAPTSVTASVRNLSGVYGVASIQPPSASGVVINSSIVNQVIYWMAIGV